MTNTFTPKNNYKNCSFCSLAYTVSLLQCRPSIHLKTFSMITAIKMRKEEWERTISTGTSSRRKGTRRKYSALTRSDVLCRHSEKTKQIQKNTEKMCQSLNKKKRSKKTARDGQNKEKGRGIWRKIITGADEEERETKRLTLFKPSHTHSSTHILILTFDLSSLACCRVQLSCVSCLFQQTGWFPSRSVFGLWTPARCWTPAEMQMKESVDCEAWPTKIWPFVRWVCTSVLSDDTHITVHQYWVF